MVAVKALPMLQRTKDTALTFLKKNDFDTALYEVDHNNCRYAQNMVALYD